MSLRFTLILTTTVFASLTSIAWSQFTQTGQAGADTFGTAGANTFSTAGPTGQPGTAFPQQGPNFSNAPFGAPFGFVQPVPGGAAGDRFNQTYGITTFGFPYATGTFVSATPWFSSPAVRQQLQLNAIQYHHLYSAYVDAYTRYNQAVAAIPASMAIAERAGQLQALQEVFNNEFNATLEATVTNPELRQNFNTLSAQYQNRPATNVPAAQQALSLSAEQHRRLSLMAHQWNQLAAQLRERAAGDEAVPAEEVNKLNSEAQKQIETTLTTEQQTIWPQLVSQYYDLDHPKPQPQLPTPPTPTNTTTTPSE